MNFSMDPNVMYALLIILVLLAVATFMHLRRGGDKPAARPADPVHAQHVHAPQAQDRARAAATPNGMRGRS